MLTSSLIANGLSLTAAVKTTTTTVYSYIGMWNACYRILYDITLNFVVNTACVLQSPSILRSSGVVY